MLKIEHIGIAVSSLAASNPVFEKILGVAPYKSEKVESEGVETSFFKIGDSKIELVESNRADSAIAKFIAARGEGMHHIAFAVDDIHVEMQRMRDSGIRLLREEPFNGADNKLVCFLHPKDTGGVLVEFCQERK